jgi:ABC-type branched-subunit amino acid transport system substrate-binding protein
VDLIERTRWLTPALLVVALGCSVGEARPEGPGAPGEVTAPARPVERPAPPPAEAERLATTAMDRALRAYDRGDAGEALEGAREVLTLYPGTSLSDQALWLAARAAFSAGVYTEARDWAERFAARQTAGSAEAAQARWLADLAADALSEAASGAPVVGALLPRTGPSVLVQYGDWVLEGIELAIREAERRYGRTVQLVVADDGGGTRTAQAVAELERRGVVAIIGPLMPEQLREAAAARTDQNLMMVSPTVPESPQQLRHVYSIAGGDTHGARELARYAVQSGLLEGTILHARGGDFHRRAQAFAQEYQAGGGRVRAIVSYESGTTTFQSHMQQILRSGAAAEARARGRPFVLFIAAPDRDVPQIAPQISFYGLDNAGVQVLGDDAWSSSSVRRLVPNRDLEGVVAASPLAAGRGEAGADPAFVQLFEATYRRSLTNQVPALGYDAARVVLEALPNRLMTPEATARSFQLLTGIEGATGRLSVRDGTLVRSPHLVVIREGQVHPAPWPWARAGGSGS